MSIPLKAKVAIRDGWDKPDSAVQTAIKELHDLLGLEVRCEPDWSVLIADLNSVYEDKAQLAKSILSCLQVWFTTMSELLDDSAHEEWAEKLLEKLKESWQRLSLFVDVSDGPRASTSWNSLQRGFTIFVPKAEIHQAAQFNAIFKEQLLECFDDNKPSKSLPIHSTTGDEWADVTISEVTEKAPQPAQPKPAAAAAAVEYLPDANALPKPGTLLLRPPYHMFIHVLGANKIVIQGSHGPTLDVLSDYLKKWCRTNPNLTNKPPSLAIELNHASCCFGVYDTLTIASENRYGTFFSVSATMMLSIVEGVLGYERVFGDANTWHYRKDTPFKKA